MTGAIKSRFLPGENKGDFVLHRQQDVEPLLNNIRAKRDAEAWDTADGSMRHVGSGSYVLLESLCIEHGKTLADFFRDPEFEDKMLRLYFERYSDFKVHPGRNL